MKIAFLINTPAQVHFFKNIAKKLNENGNKVIFLARDYGETLSVLDGIGIKYFIFSKSLKSKIGEILGFPFNSFRVYKYLSSINPDLILGSVGIESFTSFFLKKPAVAFNDSEPHINNFLSLEYKLFMPFINSIITPDTFLDDLGKKQIKVKSYKELAYLHPRYFKPDENIYDLLKIDKNEEYIILRFNAFDAVHDIGIESFPLDKKRKLVKELEKYARVFISSEQEIHKDFEKYTLRIPKHKIHDCLYYAKMLVTDTQTMTTEAGILGTPVVRCNSFVGPKDMGNFIELENKYKLIFSFRNSDQAIEKAITLIQEPNIKSDWSKKKQKFFNETVDITAFMVWYIENYPNSFKEMKNKPEIQYRFR